MADIFLKPANWIIVGLVSLVLAAIAFAVFQPVQVIPRIAYGPEYDLVDQYGERVTEETLAGDIVLFGFGYTHDPTGRLSQTLDDMRAFEARLEQEGLTESVRLALILFDDERDTLEKRHEFAGEQNLDGWLVLGGEAETLKRIIGGGFGIYYEAVPLLDLVESQPEIADRLEQPVGSEEMAYLQAERFVLIDDRNIIRAEYRAPLDLDMVTRDTRYIIREQNSTGANKALNEAAHLFLCYPQ